ncbi:hypothetical protein M6B38_383865 [Iris pallida]|uniref:Uncharacterized protein n=1 Tax=Iris pallida TaxID=29817 RepID=A0AAX6G4G6_IRIPA|nr:hypothetical protein M6B38_383865 [Iris pallida]
MEWGNSNSHQAFFSLKLVTTSTLYKFQLPSELSISVEHSLSSPIPFSPSKFLNLNFYSSREQQIMMMMMVTTPFGS